MNLFQTKDIVLHSGVRSNFKIECDALTDDDWRTLAALVAKHYDFGAVEPVLRGGLSFGLALSRHIQPEHPRLLIVDDVLTTAASMVEQLAGRDPYEENIQGIVVFSRTYYFPKWIDPIFLMWE